MSAPLEHTTATLTPTAPTPKDHSTARVTRDSREMESPVKVWQLIKIVRLKRELFKQNTRLTRKT